METADTHDRSSARCGDLIVPHCRCHHARKARRRVSRGERNEHQSVRKFDHGGLLNVPATAGTSGFRQQWLSGNRLKKRVPELFGTRKTPPARMRTVRSCFPAGPLTAAEKSSEKATVFVGPTYAQYASVAHFAIGSIPVGVRGQVIASMPLRSITSKRRTEGPLGERFPCSHWAMVLLPTFRKAAKTA